MFLKSWMIPVPEVEELALSRTIRISVVLLLLTCVCKKTHRIVTVCKVVIIDGKWIVQTPTGVSYQFLFSSSNSHFNSNQPLKCNNDYWSILSDFWCVTYLISKHWKSGIVDWWIKCESQIEHCILFLSFSLFVLFACWLATCRIRYV